MSSSTCSTAGSSKDEDYDDDVGEEEEGDGPVLAWSHVVASQPLAENASEEAEV
jgi:hypothetical protein